MAVKKHIVKQGECFVTIAHTYGIPNWKSIYDLPENADLRKKRPNPNILCPGDVVCVPEGRQNDIKVKTHSKNTFKATPKEYQCYFTLKMIDGDNKPHANVPFKLTIEGRDTIEGNTDSTGLIDVPIPDDAYKGKLEVLGGTFQVELGAIDPISKLTGIQQRLSNLGYDVGAADGKFGMFTLAAIMSFQEDNNLAVTGEINDATRLKLAQMHDGVSSITEPEDNFAFSDESAFVGDQGSEDEEALDPVEDVTNNINFAEIDREIMEQIQE